MDIEAQKRQAAAVAVEWVRPGMRLGLGTGSTARHFVGVPLTTLDETPELDMTVDGADEIGPDLTLIKGGGGALLREKIVAAASGRMVVIADESKWVPVLGRFPLPIEVMPFGFEATKRAVEAVCAAPAALRKGKNGHAFVTDGGHWILDARLERISDPKSLSERLFRIPGVVEHGLFIGMAQAAILAGPAGARVVERP
jgi:ribose 5-phosphate isomerase A